MADELDPVGTNERYLELRSELRELRSAVHESDFDPFVAFETSPLIYNFRQINDEMAGHLVVFVANDLGLPIAFRPRGVSKAVQNEVRLEILDEKYKRAEDLNRVRNEILRDSKIHKALVATVQPDEVRYHLPGTGGGETNFITVREAVGLVDFCTHGSQKNCLQY